MPSWLWCTCIVTLVTVGQYVTPTGAQVSVSLLDTQLRVQEGEQFSVRVRKTGPVTEEIVVVVAINNDDTSDFIGNSQVGRFQVDGLDETSTLFTVRDDDIPELEESYTFTLQVVGGKATVTEPSTATVTVLTNDDAYGRFSFSEGTILQTVEDLDVQSLGLEVTRSQGMFGAVTLQYRVSGDSDSAVPGQDITPVSGDIDFAEGDTNKLLIFEIQPDQIPENLEVFTVSLTTANPQAAFNISERQIAIAANDAPIHFSQSTVLVEEGPGTKTVSLTVNRGVQAEGSTLIGPIDSPATVSYQLISGTARLSEDFTGQNGSIGFPVNSTEQTILFQILDDSSPEIEETFQVILSEPSGDVVLTDPFNVTVKIGRSDDPNGVLHLGIRGAPQVPISFANEDQQTEFNITVFRSDGTIGDVYIQWEIERVGTDLDPVTSDLSPQQGIFQLRSGETSSTAVLSIVQDDTPEAAEKFEFRLLPNTIQGGARLEVPLSMEIVITDSDAAYGVVEFGAESRQRLITSSVPRLLELTIERAGGTLGDVNVTISVQYNQTFEITDVLGVTNPVSVGLQAGESSATLNLAINPAAFLVVGANFTVQILSAALSNDPPLGAYNSPMIGPRNIASVLVTAEAANGEIGFMSTQPLTVEELENGSNQVMLQISREGTNGRAVIYWELSGVPTANSSEVTNTDIQETNGSVVMESGMSFSEIEITVLPDNKPETDEVLSVTLSRVEPADTQRLRPGAATVLVTIIENDNPGGTFQFFPLMEDLYTAEEEGSPVDIVVERSGGALLTRRVEYYITPNGEEEFYGAANVLLFEPGVLMMNASVVARGDGIPELTEMFSVNLRSYGTALSTIGQRTQINVTVPPNDDPYGVIHFADNPAIVYINESKVSDVQTASIRLQRSGGTFGSVVVEWTLEGDSIINPDFSSTTGSVSFGPSQTLGFIVLRSEPDEIPEPSESFTVRLQLSSSGDNTPRLGEPHTATVIINVNDHPVYFKGPLHLTTDEPSQVQLTVVRDGIPNFRAEVKYRTLDGTATRLDGDFIAVFIGTLTFEVGESEKTISIDILDDITPENDEIFNVELFDPQGDIIVSDEGNITIVIAANDDASGVFEFSPPLFQQVDEGVNASFDVIRQRGDFGVVDVFWEIEQNTTRPNAGDTADFGALTGSVRFENSQTRASVIVMPVSDSVPELSEFFNLVLINATGGVGGLFGRLGNPDSLAASIEILPNDDPNGLFSFRMDSRTATVAEDYDVGSEGSTRAQLFVERSQGTYGSVSVLWEIVSPTSGSLPTWDLLFLGTIPSGVAPAPSQQRPRSGTLPYFFNGQQDSFVSIAPNMQPRPSDLAEGFSISAWLIPFSSTNSNIITKTSQDGLTIFYSLKLRTDLLSTFLEFRYSGQGMVNRLAEASSLQNIQNGVWHNIVVVMDTGVASFYLNGALILNRTLETQSVLDNEAGQMLVGASPTSNERYIGHIQDLQILGVPLTASEVLQRYNYAVQSDLSPLSGVIEFGAGVTERSLELTSVQDDLPEPEESFVIRLVGVQGGGRIDVNNSLATITIQKSDNANGLFGFGGECDGAGTSPENQTFSCPVERLLGDYGQVTVSWVIVAEGQPVGSLLTGEFVNTSGQISFDAGQSLQVLNVIVADDLDPELAENYDVVLTGAVSGDGQPSSTLTSGASISTNTTRALLVIGENDFPYGLLQFSDAATPPSQTDPVIRPALMQPEVHTAEEAGTVSLLVVRAQGSVGRVSVEWRAEDGTATSSGANPDYEAAGGKLDFNPGQRYGYINIKINDNNIPEDDKTFTVQLLNPTGGAAVGIGSRVTVVIDYSDGAYGLFQFADNSRDISTPEEGDVGFSTVSFEVVRLGGTIGLTSIAWEVIGDTANDIVTKQGTLNFLNGQASNQFTLQIRSDAEPELDHSVIVRLVNVSKGQLGDTDKLSATLRIEANDNPYGMFTIPSSNRPILTTEEFHEVTVTIQRLFGMHGVVDVDYQTLTPSETYTFIPPGVARANYSDFTPVSATVRFIAGQDTGSFNITILDDDQPEEAESVFVRLTAVRLVQGEQPRPVPSSPSLDQDTMTFAQLLIQSNDNAYGVLELSPLRVTLYENHTGPVVNVVRRRGLFGEIVVNYKITDITTTKGQDYTGLSTDVILSEGEETKPLLVDIKDDDIPELAETFTIELLSGTTGGAVLGNNTIATVTIAPSDDPSGVFSFSSPGVSVTEPLEAEGRQINVTITRSGGTMGVVKVRWQAFFNNSAATSEITPVSGTEVFVSNEAHMDITLTVLPDEIPEEQEDVIIRIVETSEGARIGSDNEFQLRILPSDNPHGFVSFSAPSFTVDERAEDSTQYLTLTRTGGQFGQLRVYYQTRAVDLLSEVYRNGSSVFDFYSVAKLGLSSDISRTSVNISGQTRPLDRCAEICLTRESCAAFQFTMATLSCETFLTADADNLQTSSTTQYYTKDMVKARFLFDISSSPGDDYIPIPEAFVVILAGASTASVPVTILADNDPELDEKFTVTLTRLQLVGRTPVNEDDVPKFGSQTSAEVVILANDNAQGVFSIFSANPSAEEGGSLIVVPEQGQLSVDLVIDREGGSIGDVTISWIVNASASSASPGVDFRADGAQLRFLDGDERAIITVSIMEDNIPEDDETIVVQLLEPGGGATVSANHSVTVVIQANDNVAGVFGISPLSVVTDEGGRIDFNVTRSAPGLGQVTVKWEIHGIDGSVPNNNLNVYQGTYVFQQGELRKSLSVEVLRDQLPELNEEYELKLTDVTTTGIRLSGAASIHPQQGTASISIRGSDDPHGVISFSSNSLYVTVQEGETNLQLFVDRKFGSSGTLRVEFEAMGGFTRQDGPGLNQATPVEDFTPVGRYIYLENGENSGVITLRIINDQVPEIDEAFLVNLTSVSLVGADTTLPPRLANTDITAQVTITANDGMQGTFVISPNSTRVSVNEGNVTLTLLVLRTGGTFGNVSVHYFPQSQTSSVIPDRDFVLAPQNLYFSHEETSKSISVEVLEDDIPEPDEEFVIVLDSPQGGAVLGEQTQASVIILANDDSGGFITFDLSDSITLTEPRGVNLADSIANFRLLRGPGIYGVITVPFVVQTQAGEENTDLSPISGYVTFQDRQVSAVLEIRAVQDDLPEIIEQFQVILQAPIGGAQLGDITERTILIRESDAPYGLLQIYPMGTRANFLNIEESAGLLHFDIVRSQGLQGNISVDVLTQSGTASVSGNTTSFSMATVQSFATQTAHRWYSFSFYGDTFAIMLTTTTTDATSTVIGGNELSPAIGQSVLYEWKEGFSLVQVLETDGATGALSFVQGEIIYLVITNAGSEGRRESVSRVYSMNEEGSLSVVQELVTVGAEDVTYFTSSGQSFLVIANGQSSSGLTVLDSLVYMWDSGRSQFNTVPWQLLGGRGPKAVEAFTIGDDVYLVMANHYDSVTQKYEIESVVFKLHTNNKFAVYQYIPTQGAMDVKHTVIGGEHYLIIANGMLDGPTSANLSSVVYKWNGAGQSFQWHQNLNTESAQSLAVFTGPDQKVYVIIASEAFNSSVFVWNSAQLKFSSEWQARPASYVSVVTVNQPEKQAILVTLSNPESNPGSTLYQVTMVRDSDFIPRTSTLTFAPGETLKRTSVVVLEDDLPEDTETFYVALSNPQGGAEIGANQKASVNILSNDDAHGIIEFAEDSLDRRETEIPQQDNPVRLTVRRYRGNHGRVVVRWRLTGDQSFQDITPQFGLVEFASGQSIAIISLVIKDDLIPELAELTYVTLETVVEPGTGLPDKGAVLGTNRVAHVTVLASDSPHGVVYWEVSSVEVAEPEGTDSTVLLNIVREQGTLGDVQVWYRTTQAIQYGIEEQAASGQDYVATQGRMVIRDGASRGTVPIQLLRDDLPELGEVFLVNLTDVVLLTGSSAPGEGPSIRNPGNSVSVRILENDNARGLVLFDVITNTEGRIDTFEAYGRNHTIALKVTRVIGYFGAVLVKWQVYHRETTITDLTPSSGTVRFGPGDTEAFIYITILDDNLFEPMEQFDVKLISASEGASLGAISNVRVAILKNDSPRGLFGFVTDEVSVKESSFPGDPDGRVTLTVTRQVGAEGVVPVQWRLNAEAQNDFDPPRSGLLTFQHGEVQKTITLTTKPDKNLEGEEKFVVSIVSAEDADISHDKGDVDVVIAPDPGSSGTVSILPSYQQVYIGEPGESSPTYRGQAEVVLSRGAGIFSGITVTWSITPRDVTAFAQLEGSVKFATLQETAAITIQARDDAQPELSSLFSLQLTSVTGGAVLSSEQAAAVSNIVFVASDYPHGLFQFPAPAQIKVSEDEGFATASVVREYGSSGRVRVSFVTSSGTATANEDFVPLTGSLTFEEGESSKSIRMNIVQDAIPEGPEYFYINITDVQLLYPDDNNYTDIGGLSVDMRPAVGPLSYQTVTIDKNDNAEGTLLFATSALDTLVREEEGTARLTVSRVGGHYGEVSVGYRAENLTATAGVDYTLFPGEVVFQDGMSENMINVSIVDDLEREAAETFRVVLTSVSGGAQLGSSTTATVTIAKSDYPNGRFEFKGEVDISLANPLADVTQEVVIQRTGGLLGQQTVSWRILGPNNPGEVLSDTADIAYRLNNVDVTQGTLLWNDGEGGEKGITLYIKARDGWEIQKVYVIEIYSITGVPSGVGNGEADPQRSKLSLTVQKYGDPNGIILFGGKAQSLRTVEEPTGSTYTLRFPILRRLDTGVLGNIMVFWEVTGPITDENDILPLSGSVALENGVRAGEITIQILPDDVPELTETFHMKLMRVEGGAEISATYNTSSFDIRYNDNPHGVFGVLTDVQTVLVDPVTNERTLQLNITRNAGKFGRVQVYYGVKYDKPQLQSGIGVDHSSGSVTFEDGEQWAIAKVKVIGDGFLETDSTFSLSLTAQPVYLGSEVTQPPSLQAGQTDAKVIVPETAGNTEVGFLRDISTVDEATNLVKITVTRRGLYGTLQVRLESGLPQGQRPVGFESGEITPAFMTVTLPQGEKSKNITLQVVGRREVAEIFALHLPETPTTAAVGGARLWTGKTVTQIEPSGVIGFAPESREKTGSELAGQVTLTVERLYGSQDRIEAQFEARGGNASSTADYRLTANTVVMEPGQVTASVIVELLQDSFPERAEDFSLYLTKVEKYPTVITEQLSPRISTLYGSSYVTIKESNDPYGLMSLDEISAPLEEKDQDVTVTVRRSGGYYGAVSVIVRTVGGNEAWSSEIVVQEGVENPNIIGEALGNRIASPAVGGRDYDIVDTVVYFADGESVKTVILPVLDDNDAEPAEAIYMYLTQPQGGARIATGSPDGGLKGFLAVEIQANDYSNGLIGFTDQSLFVTVDEDVTSPKISLQLQRLNAFYGDVQVFWKIKVSLTSTTGEDESLRQQVTQINGFVTCPGGQEICSLDIPLLDDQTPEESRSFLVIVDRVGSEAVLDEGRTVANVTVTPSDYVRGLLQFVAQFSVINVDKDTKSVLLEVARLKGTGYHVEVDYATLQMPAKVRVSGVEVYPARSQEDFIATSGRLVFPPHSQELKYINLTLTPLQSRSNDYPKQLYVRLSSPTNGSSLHKDLYQAVVRIVDKSELPIWEAIKTITTEPIDNENIAQILDNLDKTVSKEIGENEGNLVEAILKDITDKGLDTVFPDPTLKPELFDIFCKLLDPQKADSRRGHHSYTKLLENFAFGLVTAQSCPYPVSPELVSYQCQNVKLSAGRWGQANITGFSYKAQYGDNFVVPNTIDGMSTQADQQGCSDFHLIEYNSEEWFYGEGQTNPQLLNSRIVSFGIKGRDSSYSDTPATFRIHTPSRAIAPRRAQCVYFEESTRTWAGVGDICQVMNNKALDVDDYVDCSCQHLTSYAVKARVTDNTGYLVWFYVSCFICIIGLAVVIITHHVCGILPRFSVCLLMHMCFACMATQICYVIAAYFSPTDILVTSLDQGNGRCIAMGLFLHYFFLAQFTWIMTQSINFWKILVMNDEHTDRKYAAFFLLGWATPAVIVAIFYVVVYNVYKYVYDMPFDFIYGDVGNSGQICFITNTLAGLGGVILPSILMLLVVCVVFVQAYQLTPQWKAYDDVYKGRHNAKEVRILLAFWVIIIFTWLWGGLHLAYRHLWMLILFCIFNITQGLYALIVYAVLRNPCLPCTRPQKASYSLGGVPTEGGGAQPYHSQPMSLSPSIKGSRAELLNESWERESITPSAQMKVRRTLPSNTNIYVTPPVLLHQPRDPDIQDFDDLLFALKTGGPFTPSEISKNPDYDNLSDISSKAGNYEMRRISIADTHL